MRIGVIADDITGSNDIGICFTKGGASTTIYSYNKDLKISADETSGVVIIDTDSRFDSAETGYRKVHHAAQILSEWGAEKFLKKTCSVFRGNIGAEFDAMQDALGEHKTMVVLGYPKNGRTTVHSVHYVYGVALSDSQFKNDPIHPMRISDLRVILGSQTGRTVKGIDFSSYTNNENLTQVINNSSENYLIFDVRSDRDLDFLASVIAPYKSFAGSSAIGEYLPKYLNLYGENNIIHKPPADRLGVLVAAGSLTEQTAKQITRAGGYMQCFTVDTLRVVQNRAKEYKKELTEALCHEIITGRNALYHTAHSQTEVAETKLCARELGLSDSEAGKIISEFMADICAEVLTQTKGSRFVSLGGDTSAAITKRLGISVMRVLDEIETGVPTLTEGCSRFIFALKSGSFGTEDFIAKAIKKLR